MTRKPRGNMPDSPPPSLLRLLDDTALLKQAGLLWPSLFARDCSDHGVPVSEDELDYYERRDWLSPLLRLPRPKQWYKPRGSGFMIRVEVPEDSEPTADLVDRYETYGTTGKILLELRDEGVLVDPQTHEETVSTYYVLYQLLHVLRLSEHVELEERWHQADSDDAAWHKYFRVRKNRLPELDFVQLGGIA